ncbi:uncharacterized protein [Oscarella lobularis]|uniref:uncharacterized protein isoform X2 n=1 Tax=Oscarella lobularis TaxID=121494 RepID=UPI003313DA91
MDQIKAALKEKNPFKRKKTLAKIEEVLRDPYAQLSSRLRDKYRNDKSRLQSDVDGLWKLRVGAFLAGLSASTQLSLDELNKSEVVLQTFSGLQFRVEPVSPYVPEDEEESLTLSHNKDLVKEMRYDSVVESGVLLAKTETEGFIYQPGDPKELGSLRFPLNTDAFAVPDKSLKALSLHCGDEVEFRLCGSTPYDVKVSKYEDMTSKEIDDYLNDLSQIADENPLSALLSIRNAFPIWRYILYGDEGRVPTHRLWRVVRLASKITASEATTLLRSAVESIFLSFAKPAFLHETLLPCCTNETDRSDFTVDEMKEFVSNFVTLLPKKANTIFPLIKIVSQSLFDVGRYVESNKFLLNTLETIASHQQIDEDDDTDVQPWNSAPLIITPKELRIASKQNHNQFADLPVVRLKQPYRSIEDYFETYFTLLRKDCYGQLCDVIRSAKLLHVDRKKHNLYKIVETTGLYFFLNGRGMAFCLKFEPLFEIDWNESEFLKEENLVAISLTGNFDDSELIWATIASQGRKHTELLKRSEVHLRFCTEENDETDAVVISRIQESTSAVFVESPAFYRAYQPVLDALQRKNIEEVPFQNALVRLKEEPQKIAYINQTTTVNEIPLFHNVAELTCSDEKIVQILEKCQCKLDKSQVDAVTSCFSRPLTLIQGPPGTGKTFLGVTITRLLLSTSTLPEGPILIMAYKNRSLDHFLNLCFDFVDERNVIRVGHTSHRRLQERCLSAVLHREKLSDRQVARRIHFNSIYRLKELKTTLRRWGENLKKSHSFSVEIFVDQATDNQIRSLVKTQESELKKDAANEPSIKAFLRNNMNNDEYVRTLSNLMEAWLPSDEEFDRIGPSDNAPKKSLFEKIQSATTATTTTVRLPADNSEFLREERKDNQNRFQSYSSYPSDMKRIYEYKVDEGVESLSFEEQLNGPLIRVKRRNLYPDDLTLFNADDLQKVTNAADRARLTQMWLNAYHRKASRLFTEAAEEYLKICQQVQERNMKLHYEILKSAKLVGITTTGAAIHQNLLLAVKPSIIIVEEACEILESNLLATLTPSVKQLIMIGDHMQLKPKVSCHELAELFYFDTSAFERLVTNDYPHVTLQEQRRMRREFLPLLKPFYPSLKSSSKVENFQLCQFLPQNLFFWSYHSDLETRKNGSFSNRLEAERVKQLVLFLLSCGENSSNITVLTFYRGQVDALYKKLQNCKSDCCGNDLLFYRAIRVRVATVDEYQGDENRIIILSLVRSNKSQTFGFLKEKNRLVVAISRQKAALIIVGNGNFFKRNPHFQTLLETIGKLGLIDNTIPVRLPDGRIKKTDEEGLKEEIVQMCSQPSVADIPLKEKFPQSDKLRAKFAPTIGTDWKFLVRELGLCEAKIDAIVQDNPHSTQEQAYKALTLWTKKMGEKATKHHVIEALREMEREDLVTELEQYT